MALSTILFSLFFGFLLVILPASAAESGCDIEFTPAVGIPGSNIFKAGVPVQLNCSSAGEYIKAIYTFSIYAGSIVAVVVLMIGGFIWLTAGGNVSQVGQARSYIGGAIAGFVLLLLSWTLLQTVNPRLVEFRGLNITPVNNIPLDVGGCGYNTQEEVNKINATPDPRGYRLVPSSDNDCQGLTRVVGTSCYCFKQTVGLTTCCAYYKRPVNINLPSCRTVTGNVPEKCVDSRSAFTSNSSQCPIGPIPVVDYTAEPSESCSAAYTRFQSQTGPDCDLCGGGT